MARAAPQSKGKGRQSSKMQSALGKKGAAAKAKKKAATGMRSSSKMQEQPAQLKEGTQKKKQQQTESKAPATPRRSPRKKTGRSAKIAKPSMTEKRGQGRKSAEDLVKDVKVVTEKVGVRLPRGKKKEQEVKQAIAKTSDRPYCDYSKQGALEVGGLTGWSCTHGLACDSTSPHHPQRQELKKTHKVTKKKGAAGKGDPFSGAPKSPRSKRGINAPPSPAEKRSTKGGGRSVRVRSWVAGSQV